MGSPARPAAPAKIKAVGGQETAAKTTTRKTTAQTRITARARMPHRHGGARDTALHLSNGLTRQSLQFTSNLCIGDDPLFSFAFSSRIIISEVCTDLQRSRSRSHFAGRPPSSETAATPPSARRPRVRNDTRLCQSVVVDASHCSSFRWACLALGPERFAFSSVLRLATISWCFSDSTWLDLRKASLRRRCACTAI